MVHVPVRPLFAALLCASGLGGGLVPSGNSTFERPLVSRGDGAAPSISSVNPLCQFLRHLSESISQSTKSFHSPRAV